MGPEESIESSHEVRARSRYAELCETSTERQMARGSGTGRKARDVRIGNAETR